MIYGDDDVDDDVRISVPPSVAMAAQVMHRRSGASVCLSVCVCVCLSTL